MKVKNILLGGAILPVLATGALCGNTFADTAPAITFSYGDPTSPTRCDVSGTNYGSPCDTNIIEWNNSSNTLTLKAGAAAKTNAFVHISSTVSNATIVATSNADVSIYADGTVITMELGSYVLHDRGYKIATGTESIGKASFSSFGGLIMKSGVFLSDGSVYAYDGELVMDGGKMTVARFDSNYNVTINGGEFSSDKLYSGDLIINAGKVNVFGNAYPERVTIAGGENVFGSISADGDISITNGDTQITCTDKSNACVDGIGLHNNATFTISGGNLAIDGFDWGISGLGETKLYFNGGVTTIKNATTHSIWIIDCANPESNIVFGEGMGIKEDTYVFYDDTTTGIAAPNGVTIASGYTYRRHYGWEDINKEKTNPKTSAYDNLLVLAVSAMALAVLGFSGKKLLDRR